MPPGAMWARLCVNGRCDKITPCTKWSGHSDNKAMKRYVDIVDFIKADSMMKFDGLS